MNFSKLSVIFLNSYLIQFCVCKFFSSSFEIAKLLDTEKKILDDLNGYFERQKKNGITFDSYVEEFVTYAEDQNNITSEAIKTIENPLAVFHLLSRTVHKWSELSKNLSCNEEQVEKCPILTGSDIITVVKRESELEWPTETELKQAARAIVNVWIVYDLDLEQVINGNLGEVTEPPLSADEIFFIANAARDSGMTYEAITWYKYLLQRLESVGAYTFKTSSLYRRLALAFKEYGMLSKAIALLQEYQKTNADDNGVARDLEYLKTSGDTYDTVKDLVRFAANDKSKQTTSRQQFEELCRSPVKGMDYSKGLQCSVIPLYNCYGQAKVETVWRRPKIEIVYDVMSENEADKIMTYGEKSFGQFYEMFPFSVKPSQPDNRLKSGPLCEWDPKYPLITNITNRLERMTKFHMFPVGDVSSSECYMMTNEASGLIHTPTVDSWPSGQQPYPYAGNRLATIMLQLSEVKYGGSVVFPKLNLTVPVRKGSAIIWRNLKDDGKPSGRAVHTTCPVMIGPHWALYKNVLYSNQLFRQPCEAR